jgi:hypothetical protein
VSRLLSTLLSTRSKNGIGRRPGGLSGLVAVGAPGRIRTFDPRIRSPPLYPLSYGRDRRHRGYRDGTPRATNTRTRPIDDGVDAPNSRVLTVPKPLNSLTQLVESSSPMAMKRPERGVLHYRPRRLSVTVSEPHGSLTATPGRNRCGTVESRSAGRPPRAGERTGDPGGWGESARTGAVERLPSSNPSANPVGGKGRRR